ncbi:MAG: SusC/RagA family TonB-linked outer membrane protein [Adhaeribacter sp.]
MKKTFEPRQLLPGRTGMGRRLMRPAQLAMLLLFAPFSLALAAKPAVSVTAKINQQVSGRITDAATGEGLPGVSIVVRGTTNGTTSDASGNYSLDVTGNDAVLVFSFIGYLKKEVPLRGQTSLNVSLETDAAQLEEVVVVGYGTLKKSSVTAAITKLENKNLDQIPAGRPETALVGKMAGVNIATARNRPGEAPVIRIRGAGTISAGNDPLVVIDGFPGGSLENVNMNDVESIEVLKDASSAAIYGSRGANGVIIVTTKKGKTGKPTLNLHAYTGVSHARGHKDWISGQEYYDYVVRYQNREFVWAGGDPSIPVWGDARRPAVYQVNPVIKEGNVNWQDAVLQPGPIQNYNLSVSGGTENAKYYVSGTYRDEQGTTLNTSYTSYGVRANLDLKINKVVSTGFMISPSYSKRRLQGMGMEGMAKYPPFVAKQNPDGTYPRARDYWGVVVSGQLNPLAILNAIQNYTYEMNNLGEVYVGLNLLKDLQFKSSFGSNINYATAEYYTAAFGTTNNAAGGSASDNRNISLVNENVLSYNKKLGDHDLSAIAGASYQKNTSRTAAMGIVVGSFGNDAIQTLNNAVISPTTTYTRKSQWGLVSYFSRLNYSFRDKYLLAASIRTDGSSRFGPGNKWGQFPSASAAWRLSQESFMQDMPAVSELKLRASYGVTGNFNIGDFAYLGTIGDAYYSPNGALTKGRMQNAYGNEELQWEKTYSYDIGLELGLFNSRLNLALDYYDKKTTDLLFSETIPAIVGFNTFLTNIGEVNNRGVELELNTKNFTGDFRWETAFNVTRNRNKLVNLGNAQEIVVPDTYGMNWILRPGQPLFSYYGYKAIGVLQNADDVANSPVLPNSKPGNTKYQDTNGDNKITPADMVVLGSYMPKAVLGMTNSFAFRNFDLSVVLQASLGGKMYNFENEYYQGPLAGAMRRSLVETQWWSEDEPGDGRMPGAALSTLTFQANSDIYIEDASYLSMRNLNLGYTLPSSLTQKLRLSNLRLYTSMSNMIMLTKKGFHAYNPEAATRGDIGGTLNAMPGYNGGSDPINRTLVVGINLNF